MATFEDSNGKKDVKQGFGYQACVGGENYYIAATWEFHPWKYYVTACCTS